VFAQEFVDLLLGFRFGVAILFLKQAEQLVALAGELIQFIVGEFAPPRLGFATSLLPHSLENIFCSHSISHPFCRL
jgi:hypothetical protein